jgi:hypothetical protein
VPNVTPFPAPQAPASPSVPTPGPGQWISDEGLFAIIEAAKRSVTGWQPSAGPMPQLEGRFYTTAEITEMYRQHEHVLRASFMAHYEPDVPVDPPSRRLSVVR